MTLEKGVLCLFIRISTREKNKQCSRQRGTPALALFTQVIAITGLPTGRNVDAEPARTNKPAPIRCPRWSGAEQHDNEATCSCFDATTTRHTLTFSSPLTYLHYVDEYNVRHTIDTSWFLRHHLIDCQLGSSQFISAYKEMGLLKYLKQLTSKR